MADSTMDSLHYEDFVPHINSKFRAQLRDLSTLELELINVEEKSPSPRQEQFVLTFRAPSTAPPEQQIFTLQHEALGSGIMFLVPIGRDANGLIYEAVFNRPSMTEPISAPSPGSTVAVTLRPAGPDDEAFLAAVYGSTREQELAMVPWTTEQRETFIRFQYLAQLQHYQAEYPKAEHQVILAGGQPVGRVYVDRRDAEIRILDLTLLTPHRGQGIGTPIIRGLMDEAARVGKSLSIHLDSFSQSHSLFERLGFKPAETTGFHVLYVWRFDQPL